VKAEKMQDLKYKIVEEHLKSLSSNEASQSDFTETSCEDLGSDEINQQAQA
jgi:hypothetical protein